MREGATRGSHSGFVGYGLGESPSQFRRRGDESGFLSVILSKEFKI
jgi:hypothetical protein